jgi:2-oxoglutarate dehydrogenase complex dehydrogenase (E1) component-like enzyme
MSDRPFDQQNAGYAQELYEQYALNPQSVPESWRRFFAQGHQAAAQAGLILPESLHQNGNGASAHAYPAPTNGVATNGAAA